jgi:lysophospholipase L1-like esterase
MERKEKRYFEAAMADPAFLLTQALNRDLNRDLRTVSPVQWRDRAQSSVIVSSQPWRSIAQPEILPQNADQPRSGSQLYAQRLAALRSGRLSTRLPGHSFQEIWQRATQQPTYDQWRKLLELEARAVARGQHNRRLTVVLGDSLSLWFPYQNLPQDQLWLNQGISGDTTANVLRRVGSFDRTRPDLIYVMAGVNDLRRGATDEEILLNLQRLMRQLQQRHPQAKIVMQSILPTRLDRIAPQRIAGLNWVLQRLAQRQGVGYLDLYGKFVDTDGRMQMAYTTDGVHLSRQGYATWQSAIVQHKISRN